MHLLSGGCHCGNIHLELALSRAPDTYAPRACDCDFCTKHNAAYLSDAQGKLSVRIRDMTQVSRYRQGSGQAEFLVCAGCGVLTAVAFQEQATLYGAVNARAVNGAKDFAAPQPVSPKTLSGDEKSERWKKVWFSNVVINS